MRQLESKACRSAHTVRLSVCQESGQKDLAALIEVNGGYAMPYIKYQMQQAIAIFGKDHDDLVDITGTFYYDSDTLTQAGVELQLIPRDENSPVLKGTYSEPDPHRMNVKQSIFATLLAADNRYTIQMWWASPSGADYLQWSSVEYKAATPPLDLGGGTAGIAIPTTGSYPS